jgi:hypothetical protein
MYGDHPPGFGTQHPWHDPLAPQDVLNPRPDADLAIAGSLAPRPEDFPFTDQGRRDYYAAVGSAARQQLMMQHRHVHEIDAVQGIRVREEAAAHARQIQQASFLLLMS